MNPGGASPAPVALWQAGGTTCLGLPGGRSHPEPESAGQSGQSVTKSIGHSDCSLRHDNLSIARIVTL